MLYSDIVASPDQLPREGEILHSDKHIIYYLHFGVSGPIQAASTCAEIQRPDLHQCPVIVFAKQ